jgi:hypothetical protein
MSGRGFLARTRLPDFFDKSFLASRELPIVRPGFRKTQRAVRSTSDEILIVIILAIIFPEADRADVEYSAFFECPAIIARTTER